MMDTLLERVAPADYRSVGVLRRATNAFLQIDAQDQFLAALLLVVSELSTNAIEALSDATAEFTLRVHHCDDRVEIEVADSGDGFGDALQRPGASGSDPRGRGLQIVRSLVDEMHVERGAGVTTISCVMRKRCPAGD